MERPAVCPGCRALPQPVAHPEGGSCDRPGRRCRAWHRSVDPLSDRREFPGESGPAPRLGLSHQCHVASRRTSGLTHNWGIHMEFGLFIQGYTPNFRREEDPDAEHHALMDELEVVQAADKAGFKYVWVTEHHFLDEYSHLSANDVVLGYLAHATERIHLGSGIFNPLPQVNHPAKVAERVAMLDHLSDGPLRVRHRPGGGQPRDPRLPPRHEGPVGHPGDLGGRHRGVPQDVAPGHL